MRRWIISSLIILPSTALAVRSPSSAHGYTGNFDLLAKEKTWRHLAVSYSHSPILEHANAMRVIAGKYRSRVLRSLRGLDLRPTADRLRETLFDVLTAGNPSALEGTVWLDLFAGTGAVGIESLSRGAGMVYFVEASARAAALIESNLQSLGSKTGFQISRQDAVRTIHALNGRGVQVDFVFLDPPYRMQPAYRSALESLAASHLLKPTTIVIAEHHKKFDPPAEVGPLRRYRLLQQGDAALSFYRREP